MEFGEIEQEEQPEPDGEEKRNTVSPEEYQEMIVQFRKINLHFQQMCGMPAGELTMMLTIHRLMEQGASVTVSKLGKVLYLSKPAVSRMLHTLKRKGYIQMSCGQDDHRFVHVEYTEDGLRRMQEELSKGVSAMRRVFSRMGREDMSRLLHYCYRFCSILSEEISEE